MTKRKQGRPRITPAEKLRRAREAATLYKAEMLAQQRAGRVPSRERALERLVRRTKRSKRTLEADLAYAASIEQTANHAAAVDDPPGFGAGLRERVLGDRLSFPAEWRRGIALLRGRSSRRFDRD